MAKNATQSNFGSNAPMLLCRVSWLPHYDGELDGLHSNHSFVTDGGIPHESKNFLPTPDGYLQGFVQVREWNKIRIERLGASKSDIEIQGITVVWCAQHPLGRGLVVVGWYRDATVFREPRKARDSRTVGDNDEIYMRIEALASNSVLLDASARNFIVQPKGAPQGSVFGQSDLCYVDERLPDLASQIRKYIAGIGQTISHTSGFSGEPDPERNERVEKAAIARVIEHYKNWEISDRQADNCGWDLEARKSGELLCIEVKGRSPTAPAAVRLSPNEERAFVRAISDPKFAKSYRLAIVHDALGASPTLRIYAFFIESGWTCEITGEGLITQSAGIFASPIPKA